MTEQDRGGWQYRTYRYKRSDGSYRSHRKKIWDACPMCGQKKRVSARMCRDCYEMKNTDREELIKCIRLVLDHYGQDGVIPKRVLLRMRRAAGNRGDE